MSLHNDPDACTTVAALHDAYEQALVANDVAALKAFFWDAPEAVRFGIREQSYGATAIATYRQAAVPTQTGRRLLQRRLVSFGPDVVSVMSEVSADGRADSVLVRQSQLWIRFPDLGWKIASAHVSQSAGPADPWAAYATQAARAAKLPLDGAGVSDVALHLERAATLAAPLLAHPVPDHIERAGLFTA